MIIERDTLALAKAAHADHERLGWRPFSIFQTDRGTWAFFTNRQPAERRASPPFYAR